MQPVGHRLQQKQSSLLHRRPQHGVAATKRQPRTDTNEHEIKDSIRVNSRPFVVKKQDSQGLLYTFFQDRAGKRGLHKRPQRSLRIQSSAVLENRRVLPIAYFRRKQSQPLLSSFTYVQETICDLLLVPVLGFKIF
jgi:hypothetical protein